MCVIKVGTRWHQMAEHKPVMGDEFDMYTFRVPWLHCAVFCHSEMGTAVHVFATSTFMHVWLTLYNWESVIKTQERIQWRNVFIIGLWQWSEKLGYTVPGGLTGWKWKRKETWRRWEVIGNVWRSAHNKHIHISITSNLVFCMIFFVKILSCNKYYDNAACLYNPTKNVRNELCSQFPPPYKCWVNVARSVKCIFRFLG